MPETILVTGANRGIGLELTRHFLTSGWKVIAACRDVRNAKELAGLSAASLSVVELDVRDDASVTRLCASLGDAPIDVLLNNAGIWGGSRQDLDGMDYAAWMEAFEVNTLGPYRLSTALRKNLRAAKRPRIVTLSSQMGSLNRKSTGSYVYRSSKAAVNKVMQVLALELESEGIVVCPVHPGWVRTDMGGPNADISVEQSAAGLLRLIDSLTLAHSGRFWTWEGLEHPW